MGLRFDDEYVAIPHGLHSPYPYFEIMLPIERDLAYLKYVMELAGMRSSELHKRLPFISNEAGIFQGEVRGCNLTRPLCRILNRRENPSDVWKYIKFDEADWYFDWNNPLVYSARCRCIKRRDPFDKRRIYKSVF